MLTVTIRRISKPSEPLKEDSRAQDDELPYATIEDVKLLGQEVADSNTGTIALLLKLYQIVDVLAATASIPQKAMIKKIIESDSFSGCQDECCCCNRR